MTLVETQLAARLRLGDGGDVIGELEAAVAAYPFQEGLWELLITALYRAGRQADALAAYQRVRALLADELGLDPGPRLQRARAADPGPRPALGVGDRAAQRLRRTRAGNLPSLSAELVGRDAEIAAVSRPAREQPARRDRRARAASARPRVAIATGRGSPSRTTSRRAASGWPGSRPRRPPTTSSTR